jgi:4-alpha-glucanotransferase
LQIVARDDGLAALHELASYPLVHNFGDTLRRSAEVYYDKITHGSQRSPAAGGIASAHDRVDFVHRITAEDVVADALPRVVFLDRYAAPDDEAQAVTRYAFDGFNAAQRSLAFCAAVGGGLLRKRYEVAGSRLKVVYAFDRVAAGSFSTELNLSLPACGGFSGRYILADGTIPCGFGQELVQTEVTRIALDDRELGGAIELTSSVPLALHAAPHYTVSQSEAGFEKVMQAATLTLSWPLSAATATVEIELAVKCG